MFSLITSRLPATSPLTYAIQCMYTVNLFCSYPLQLSPAVTLLESYVFDTVNKPTPTRYWMQNLARTGMVAFTIVVGLSIYSKIDLFLDILSAATCSPLAFTLPALFHYKLCGYNKSDLFIVIVTTALSIFMVSQAVYELIDDLI